MKKSIVGGIKGGVGALRKVEALLLPASDLLDRLWGPASSFFFSVELAGRLLQELC